MDLVTNAKKELREFQNPFFTEEEITYYIFEKHDGNFNDAMYEMCLVKAENDSINLPGGLSIANNENYWIRLSKKYRPKKRSFIL